MSASLPLGVCLLNNSNPVPQAALDNPSVDGVTIGSNWCDLAPTASGGTPDYTWTYIDTECQRVKDAGKFVNLRIQTGSGGLTMSAGNVPDWVIAEIVAGSNQFFTFIDTNSGGIQRWIPTFWDTNFMSRKRELYQDLATHVLAQPYASAIRVAFVGFANGQSNDWSVPDSSTPDGLGGTGDCQVGRWQDLGYTTQKVIDSGCATGNTNGMIDNAAIAFGSNVSISFAAAQTRTSLDPLGKRYAAQTALSNARTKYGTQVSITVNSLCQKVAVNNPYSTQPDDALYELLYDAVVAGTQVSAQMIGGSGNTATFCEPGYTGTRSQALRTAVDCGKDYSTKFQEIFSNDITETSENIPEALTYAHNRLTSSAQIRLPRKQTRGFFS